MAFYTNARRALYVITRPLLSRNGITMSRTAVTDWFAVKTSYPSWKFISTTSPSLTSTLTPELKSQFDGIVQKNKVVVFMKGVPDAPRCGFSNAVAQILRMHGVEYASYDVLADESLRQGIKDYSNWPTIPQVYINGNFVGGCDILLQMHRTGELIETLKEAGISSSLKEQINPDSTNKCSK